METITAFVAVLIAYFLGRLHATKQIRKECEAVIAESKELWFRITNNAFNAGIKKATETDKK